MTSTNIGCFLYVVFCIFVSCVFAYFFAKKEDDVPFVVYISFMAGLFWPFVIIASPLFLTVWYVHRKK